MALMTDLRAIEVDVPWLSEDFQAGLEVLSGSVADQARRFAADMMLLAELTAMVPRCPFDERGATPWTSFRREVAVARRLSDRGAAAEIRAAVALTTCLPRTLELLGQGQVTVQRARAFLTALETVDDAVALAVDEQLADKVVKLSVARIQQEVRRAVLRIDPDEAARRTADKNDSRDVLFLPDKDDQVSVVIAGPAVPATRWYQTLDQRARALKAAGDPRTLAQLRFDLAVTGYPCATHTPPDPTNAAGEAEAAVGTPAVPDPRTLAQLRFDLAVTGYPCATHTPPDPINAPGEPGAAAAAAGLRPTFVEPASTDCRLSRPVQAHISVPVETALGLSNEPGWLDGYGWLSAPSCRLLLVDAELRRICVQAGSGQLVDVADQLVRPTPSPTGVRQSILDMVLDDLTLGRSPTGADPGGPPDDHPGWREEPRHDPSISLARFVQLRDRICDGPTQSWVPADRADLDHERPWPSGPTAAWNLVARGRRTHLLKHYGWTPLRTPTTTIWISPAGQTIEVDRFQFRPPGVDADQDGYLGEATLPDAEQLHALDRDQLLPRGDDLPPWVPREERPEPSDWVWLHQQLDDGVPTAPSIAAAS